MTKDLHELARKYARKMIDRDSYRKSRSELIKGICAGEIEVKTREYLAPVKNLPEELAETGQNIVTQFSRSEKNTTASEKPGHPPWSIKQKNILIGMVVTLLLAVIILATLLLPITDDSAPTQKIEIPVVKSNTGQILITDFIQQKNWSQNNMKSFITSWQSLSEQDHSATTGSPEMKRLINIIYQRLLGERALLSLGDVENAVANQQSLINFADELGIDDGRLTILDPVPKIVDIDVEVEEVSIQTTPDSNIGTMAEATNGIEESFMVNEEPLNSLTEEPIEEEPIEEEPIETIVATNDQSESSPAFTTEPIDVDVEENTAKEIPKDATMLEPEETKIIARKSMNKAACKTSLVKSRKPFCQDRIEGAGNGPKMVVIRSGKFTMGGKEKTEQPVHTVTINSPFAMSVHEISFGEYEIFCQSENLSCPKQPWLGKDYPVVNVSHSDAISYTEWLSQKTEQLYRLPTEAEWEYAARAGTKTEYPFGDKILITDAVFSAKKKLSAPLPKTDRSINRNKFRLYHMVGNIREWVADSWHDGYSGAPEDGRVRVSDVNEFVVRGGSYTDSSNALRSGAREKLSSADKYTGFRVLQELSE